MIHRTILHQPSSAHFMKYSSPTNQGTVSPIRSTSTPVLSLYENYETKEEIPVVLDLSRRIKNVTPQHDTEYKHPFLSPEWSPTLLPVKSPKSPYNIDLITAPLSIELSQIKEEKSEKFEAPNPPLTLPVDDHKALVLAAAIPSTSKGDHILTSPADDHRALALTASVPSRSKTNHRTYKESHLSHSATPPLKSPSDCQTSKHNGLVISATPPSTSTGDHQTFKPNAVIPASLTLPAENNYTDKSLIREIHPNNYKYNHNGLILEMTRPLTLSNFQNANPWTYCNNPAVSHRLNNNAISNLSLPPIQTLQNGPSFHKKASRPFKLISGALGEMCRNSFNKLAYFIGDINQCPKTWNLIEQSISNYINYRNNILGRFYSEDYKTNEKMRRRPTINDRADDPEYIEKRKKNNEAAKRSRILRKQKQDESVIRARFLEQENCTLKLTIQSEYKELERLRSID